MTNGTSICGACGALVQTGESYCSRCEPLTNAQRYEIWQQRYGSSTAELKAQGPTGAESASAAAPPSRQAAVPTGQSATTPVPGPHKTNTMAVVAFVVALAVCGPLGLFLGYSARNEIDRTGEQGSGFATAAIVLGWIWVAGFIFVALAGFALVLTPATT